MEGSMRHSTRPYRLRRALRGLAVLVLALTMIAALGCFGARHKRHHTRHGFTGDTGTVQIISAEVGGKNVFIPSTIAVRSGAPVTLSIFNTTEKPHGFSIPALGISEVLPVGEEHVIELPAMDGHQLLQINCQLHTTHRTATLMVLPAGSSDGEPPAHHGDHAK
jgi:hypothetical protein